MNRFERTIADEVFRLERALDVAHLYDTASAVYTDADAIADVSGNTMNTADNWADVLSASNPAANLREVADMLGGYDTVTSRIQELAPAENALSDAIGAFALDTDTLRDSVLDTHALSAHSLGTDLLTSFGQHTADLSYPLSTYMSDVSAAAMETAASSWKPVLMRQSWLPETSFVASLPVREHTIYSAVRSEILSVADQLSQAFHIPQQNMFVDYMGTPFELDFDFHIQPDIDLGVMPFADEPVEADSARTRVVVRDAIVWLDGKPLVLRIMGTVVGEAAGTSVTLVSDSAAGAVMGGSLGAGLAVALAEGFVVVVKRWRKRL